MVLKESLSTLLSSKGSLLSCTTLSSSEISTSPGDFKTFGWRLKSGSAEGSELLSLSAGGEMVMGFSLGRLIA